MYFYYNNDYILTNGDEMENTNKQEHIDETLIKDVVMMAGRILLESGAEGTRVEDTMTRIARKLDILKAIASLQIQSFNLLYITNLIPEYLELIPVILISLKFHKQMKYHD